MAGVLVNARARLEDGPPWVTITRIFLGLGWLRAAAEKALAVEWWTGDTITDFVLEHEAVTLPWIRPITGVALTATPLFIVCLVTAQLFVGLALVTNRHLTAGLVAATIMNLGFLAIGEVNPSAFYLVSQGALMLWVVGRERGTFSTTVPLIIAEALAVALALISLPAMQTLHPARLVDDPAVMVVTLAGLAALGCELTRRAATVGSNTVEVDTVTGHEDEFPTEREMAGTYR